MASPSFSPAGLAAVQEVEESLAQNQTGAGRQVEEELVSRYLSEEAQAFGSAEALALIRYLCSSLTLLE